MGLYIRKSISLGPFRFNLSKAGVGVSVGIPGFRVGTSPRGNYVHMGAGGVYYRATLPGGRREVHGRPAVQPASAPTEDIQLSEIESSATASIVDSSSEELVAELNSKRRKLRIWPWILASGVAVSLALSSRMSTPPQWVLLTLLGLVLLATAVAAFFDRVRKTTVLMYDFEAGMDIKFEQLDAAFDEFASCGGRWHVSAEGQVRDRKYHAGASSVVSRKAISVGKGNPPFVKTNVPVPSVPVGKQTLYFFPDKVLVFESNAVGAVSYENLSVQGAETRFIESSSVPRDAKVVDTTWRYVNKNGGPDRRFKDNRELPIALYEEVTFSSHTGLNEVVQVSRIGIAKEIAAAVSGLARGEHPSTTRARHAR